jgi:hypothetical protein
MARRHTFDSVIVRTVGGSSSKHADANERPTSTYETLAQFPKHKLQLGNIDHDVYPVGGVDMSELNATANSEPQELAEPEQVAEPQEVSEPQESAEPQQASEPHEVAEPQEVVGAQEAAEPQEVAEPQQVAEPQAASPEGNP